jgi:hypothetical protein
MPREGQTGRECGNWALYFLISVFPLFTCKIAGAWEYSILRKSMLTCTHQAVQTRKWVDLMVAIYSWYKTPN